jgi:predicted RNA binding protein YcfA (HicA-like mRNA interferase family)
MPTSRDLLRFLRSHGYREVRQSGSHLILEHAERPMLVIPVHRGKDLPRGLFIRILKAAGFTLEEFRKS